MSCIAHVRENDGKHQLVEEHLRGVQTLAEAYGDKIGVKHIAGLAGVLHDMGKSTKQFQTYLFEAINNPSEAPKRGSVDHSTAGGKLLYEMFHTGAPSRLNWLLAEVVGNAIISHHSYLHDFLNPDLESRYLDRVRDKEIQEFNQAKRYFFDNVMNMAEFEAYVSKACTELEAYLAKPFSGTYENRLMFLTKYVFSALIDADRTDTRRFEENVPDEPAVDEQMLFMDYYDKLMVKLNTLATSKKAAEEINRLRQELSEKCEQFAQWPSGIYTLSIPTGGGKTMASLRYALRHARLYKKQRIIYVVPYTTIIEQNADEVRRILKDERHILEHHANVIFDVDDDDERQDGFISTAHKLKLARDNWDSPIIFTTMVQFLNIFYAKGNRNIRRLHNLSEAIIIFDEVQKVPVHCVSLFNYALNFLTVYGNCSLVLCTATQPALNFVEQPLAIGKNAEMIDNLEHVAESFKRVEIIDRASNETFDHERLAQLISEKIDEVQSVLVILNTKAVVKQLYLLLRDSEIPVYHLSTAMCAAHRNHILEQVSGHLDREEKVICISTQLIEAGVDISFACVVRSLAGLDSIAQAAGRCNRHGKRDTGYVYVIDHGGENLDHLPKIKAGKQIARQIFIDLKRNSGSYRGSILSARAMTRYFEEFYTRFRSSLNYFINTLGKDMTELLAGERKENTYDQAYTVEKRESLPLFIRNSYRTAAEHFRVIADENTAVIAPYGDVGKKIIASLNGDKTIEDLSALLRRAQKYTVNIFPFERERLIENDGLCAYQERKILALKESAYNEEFGLDPENDSEFEFRMF
ncbi:CRISPR-associated helicase Cas3' [Paenibacillus sp. GCM10027626]|uniref:CRISPR-associated helicase Cas3' n=1 Tax=Paenibacillus sp. GCM10027626 TaxID=3273411 RepID=UPI00363A3BB4